MTLAKKMNKYFGNLAGTWWCKFAKCLYIFSVNEMKDMDEKGEISWGKLTEDSKTITPICPYHGTPLSHAEDGGTIQLGDGVQLIM